MNIAKILSVFGYAASGAVAMAKLVTNTVVTVSALSEEGLSRVSDIIAEQDKDAAPAPEDVLHAWAIISARYPALQGVKLENLVKQYKAAAVVESVTERLSPNVRNFVVEGVLFIQRLRSRNNA